MFICCFISAADPFLDLHSILGGAYSIDRYARTEGVDWFPEEIPSREEYEEGLDNLEKCGYRVDYIITHTAPFEVAAALGYGEESLDEVAPLI